MRPFDDIRSDLLAQLREDNNALPDLARMSALLYNWLYQADNHAQEIFEADQAHFIKVATEKDISTIEDFLQLFTTLVTSRACYNGTTRFIADTYVSYSQSKDTAAAQGLHLPLELGVKLFNDHTRFPDKKPRCLSEYSSVLLCLQFFRAYANSVPASHPFSATNSDGVTGNLRIFLSVHYIWVGDIANDLRFNIADPDAVVPHCKIPPASRKHACFRTHPGPGLDPKDTMEPLCMTPNEAVSILLEVALSVLAERAHYEVNLREVVDSLVEFTAFLIEERSLPAIKCLLGWARTWATFAQITQNPVLTARLNHDLATKLVDATNLVLDSKTPTSENSSKGKGRATAGNAAAAISAKSEGDNREMKEELAAESMLLRQERRLYKKAAKLSPRDAVVCIHFLRTDPKVKTQPLSEHIDVALKQCAKLVNELRQASESYKLAIGTTPTAKEMANQVTPAEHALGRLMAFIRAHQLKALQAQDDKVGEDKVEGFLRVLLTHGLAKPSYTPYALGHTPYFVEARPGDVRFLLANQDILRYCLNLCRDSHEAILSRHLEAHDYAHGLIWSTGLANSHPRRTVAPPRSTGLGVMRSSCSRFQSCYVQPVFVCTTCTVTPNCAGLCEHCALNCHHALDHEVVYIGPHSGFVCDCSKSSKYHCTCLLNPEGEAINGDGFVYDRDSFSIPPRVCYKPELVSEDDQPPSAGCKFGQKLLSSFTEDDRVMVKLSSDAPSVSVHPTDLVMCIQCEEWSHPCCSFDDPEDLENINTTAFLCNPCYDGQDAGAMGAAGSGAGSSKRPAPAGGSGGAAAGSSKRPKGS